MSNERLRAYLLKDGMEDEVVFAMERSQLLEEWGARVAEAQEKEPEEGMLTPPEDRVTVTQSQNPVMGAEYELQKLRFEFEVRKWEEERRIKEREVVLMEEERAERKKREERERGC